MDALTIQERVAALGFDPGPRDGDLGPRTYAGIFSAVARRKLPNGIEFGRGAVAHFPRYEITTALRMIHWLGQNAHESGGFFYLRELGKQSYFHKLYDIGGARPDVARRLGNTQPGDGIRYCGRSLIQLTGRANYRTTGKRIGLDLEHSPELAEQPANAVLIACDYWGSRNINRHADRDDLEAVTLAINGGRNGLDDRRKYTARARELLL
jgi:putative chitinase